MIILALVAFIFVNPLLQAQQKGIEEADDLFYAALYAEAIPLYQKILVEPEGDPHEPLIRLKVAQAYFYLDKFEEAEAMIQVNRLTELDSSRGDQEEIRKKSIYLSALIARARGQYDQAISFFKEYLESEGSFLDFYEEGLFEIGLAYYQSKDFKAAESSFKLLIQEGKNARLMTLAHFYLARIRLAEGKPGPAETILMGLEVCEDPALIYELAYLRGEIYLQTHDYSRAAKAFEEALPPHWATSSHCPWIHDALYQLGSSYLKAAEEEINSPDQAQYLAKSVETFQKLLAIHPDEKVYLALGQCYLASASLNNDERAYALAEEVLSKQDCFETKEAQAHALLLRAQAASFYADRDKFYRQLTQEANKGSAFYAKGWLMRGLNDFEEGKKLLHAGQSLVANQVFEGAAASFEKAFELLKTDQKEHAGMAIKYHALALAAHSSLDYKSKAYQRLEEIEPDVYGALEHPDEIFYLRGALAAEIAEEDEAYGALAEESLATGIERFPHGKYADMMLNLLGALHYRNKDWLKAEETYSRLIREYPHSSSLSEALFWTANCADKMGCDPEIGRQRRRAVFEIYPDSRFAAEAYFTTYSYREYLQGSRAALKHLHGLISQFPSSPFVIQAHYLMGMDYKRDRKTQEGKKLRKKSLTAAIDAFQRAESAYDLLLQKGEIPSEDRLFYLNIRYRASMERGLANLSVAEESQGAKKQIYLEYAEELFRQLVEDFENPERQIAKDLIQGNPFPFQYEENCFWLAQTYLKNENQTAAEKVFSQMLDRYKMAKITRGYFLSRVWYELGMLAMQRKEHPLALKCLKHAEDSAKGRGILSTDQRLDLWIQQSLCYLGINQVEHAILLLSKVVNDDAISGLRLKAMYLRAEMYERQGRHEIARKQLESMIKKGGEWAQKAREKLGKDYGY